MDTYRTQLNELGTRALAAHKQAADWQLGQVRLAEKQSAVAFDLCRTGFEANVAAAQGIGRTWLDAMFPTAKEN